MKKLDVYLEKVELQEKSEFSDTFYRNCSFCEKFIKITSSNFNSCLNIGKNQYCPFCLRHNFHYKNNHNILIFSFRGIIGYYYHKIYKSDPFQITISEIENIIENQSLIGLQSPALCYDPFTLLWFADFNKIGSDSHKAPFDEVKEVVKKMFDLFEYKWILSKNSQSVLWDRFEKSINLFYKQRKRPIEKKMLIPTLSGIQPLESEEFYEKTRVFTKNKLIVK